MKPETPTENRKAELSVIGGCLLSMNARDDVLGVLRPEHFYAEDTRLIFGAIAEMHNAGLNAVDANTVADWLEKTKSLERAGGVLLIMECLESVPHAAHSDYYAKQIIEAAQRRAGMQIGQDLTRESSQQSKPVLDTLADAETRIHAAMESTTGDEPTSIGDVLAEVLVELSTGKETVRHIGTEWRAVEEFSNGVPFGGMVILAARPSMGKTALALSYGLRVAEAGIPVLICEMEMRRIDLSQRCLSIVSGLDFYKLEKNKLTQPERESVLQNSAIMGKWPLFLDDSCRGQIALQTMIRRMVRRRGVKLVIVDYLQLIEPEDRRINREQQVATITRSLKRLAMTLNIGILCLSQLNREVEKRLSKEPQLSDLRESGSIEQDADQVWFLWRTEEIYDKGILKVAKNRNGKTGKAELAWHPATMRFSGETSDPFQGKF